MDSHKPSLHNSTRTLFTAIFLIFGVCTGFSQTPTPMIRSSSANAVSESPAAVPLLKSFTHPGFSQQAEFLPDGERIVSSHERSLKVWNLSDASVIRELTSPVEIRDNGFKLSRDGKRCWCVADNWLLMWDVESGQLQYQKRMQSPIYYAQKNWDITDDGRRLLVGDMNGRLTVYDTETEQMLNEYPAPWENNYFVQVRLSPDEKQAAAITAHDNQSKILIWDLQTDLGIQIIDPEARDSHDIRWSSTPNRIWIYGIDYPDNRYLVPQLELYDTLSGEYLYRTKSRVDNVTPQTYALSPMEGLKVFINYEFRVLYHTSTEERIGNFSSLFWYARFSPDGKKLLTLNPDLTSTFSLWDLQGFPDYPLPTLVPFTPTPTRPIPPTETPTSTPTPTPLPERIERIFQIEPGQGAQDPGLIFDIEFSPDGTRAYAADYRSQVLVWDVNSGKMIKNLFVKQEFHDRIRLAQNGKQLWRSGQDGGYRTVMWDTETGTVQHDKQWPAEDYFLDWDISKDGSKVIYNTWNNGVFIWDVAADQKARVFIDPQQKKFPQVWDIALSPDDYWVALVGTNGEDQPSSQLKVWDMHTGEPIRTLSFPEKSMTDVVWHPDGRKVWVYSWEKLNQSYSMLDLWDVRNGDHLHHVEISNQLTGINNSTPILMSLDRKRFLLLDYPTNTVVVFDTFTGQELARLPHGERNVTAAEFSPDGEYVMTGTNNVLGSAIAILWNLSDLPDSPVPTLVPYTQTPTHTPTFTPTPVMPQVIDPNYEVKPLVHHLESSFYNSPYGGSYTIDPKTGDIVLASFESTIDNQNLIHIYKFPSPAQYSSTNPPYPPLYTCTAITNVAEMEVAMGEDGTIVVMQGRAFFYIFHPDGTSESFRIIRGENLAFHIVSSAARIPDTKAGDLLVLMKGNMQNYEVYKVDLTAAEKETVPLINTYDLPSFMTFSDLTEGPEGLLYLFQLGGNYSYDTSHAAAYGPVKIMVWTENKILREWSHFSFDWPEFNVIPGFCKLRYRAGEGVFYVSSAHPYRQSGKVFRIPGPNRGYYPIAHTSDYSKLVMAPNGDKIYVSSWAENSSFGYPSTLSELIIKSDITPTPTPAEPTPTPTPIKGWFVLDGFGGIHSTNPALSRPVLPYWPEFNIVRDIEPDPLGRGWYMLDGFGGIHTSSPELPRPDTLPYFGFDIARNLEVKIKNGQYQFYLLDGFGVIHSSEPNFDFGNVIWFGGDMARNLEPGSNENEWITMDAYGTLYWGASHHIDILRYTHPALISPVMNSCVRFPDNTTVMLDLFGGRHTNPYYPARNVVDGLPSGFYFPGWDIIRDLEVIPENWN